jgi:hypothetical protein
MQFRKFGRLDFEVSALGFGCMRLPVIGGDRSNIDEPEATRMLRYAIDQGVNYVDTAYLYHGGNSEHFVGRALKEGYRQRVKLATKLPPAKVKDPKDFDRLLNEQLEKLQTDHIDFYLLQGLRRDRWPKLRDLGVIPWLQVAVTDGRIGHTGFSFHDKFEFFKEIVDAYDGWDFCQIQYNFMNEDVQAGTKGLSYAARKGMAVVVMEPLLGGSLGTPSEPVLKLWNTGAGRRTPADWALQWLWNKSEVSVVLSGMTAMDHVVQNIESACHSGINSLTQDDLAFIERVREVYQGLQPISCTKCGYCMPCPSGVDIPLNFEVYNDGVRFNQMNQARKNYIRNIPEEAHASLCTQCCKCEEECPQEIKVSEWMPRVHRELSEES